MPISCNAACAGTIPRVNTADCKILTRPGGIRRFAIVSCDVEIPNVYDLEAWKYWLERCKIRISGLVIGSKPKGTYELKRLSSCLGESVVGGTKTFEIMDYNSDNTFFSDYEFYNDIQVNHTKYWVMFFGCDGRVYLPMGFTLEADEVFGDNSKDIARKEITFKIESTEIIQPVYINGLEELMLQYTEQECASYYGGSFGPIALDCPFKLETDAPIITTEAPGYLTYHYRLSRNGVEGPVQVLVTGNFDDLAFDEVAPEIDSSDEWLFRIPEDTLPGDYGVTVNITGGGCTEAALFTIPVTG